MSEHERMPLEQMFSIQQMVAAMTRTTCENECGNCNVCHLSVALAYEKFMRQGDVRHINACLGAALRKVKRLEEDIERVKDRCTQMRLWGDAGRHAATFIENAIEATS